jgi:hypothetical protein
MSAIFKNRKIPKHLIIEEEVPYRRRPGKSTGKVVGWVVLLALAGWLILQYLAFLTL